MPILSFPKSQLGAIIDVVARPSAAGLEELRRAGLPAPKPVNLKMLVDSGSDTSAMEEALATSFGLPYVSAAFAMTFNKSRPIRRYELALSLSGTNGVTWDAPPVIVIARPEAFDGTPYQGLVGRDLLDQALFIYNGPGHHCTLAF